MNKAELINSVSEKLGVSKKEATETIESVLETIIAATVETGECVIPGLGKLKVRDTKETSGTAPNGTAWAKAAGKTIKLALSAEGKTLV